MNLSKMALSIEPSLTLELSAVANQMKKNGDDVINLSVGEPDFPTPDYIVEGAKEALEKGFTKYTPTPGTLGLRKAIATKTEKTHHVSINPDQIIVSTGAKQSLLLTFMALLNPKDEVLIPKPYWLSYPEMVRIAGGQSIFVSTAAENGFKVTPKELEEKYTSHTKCLIINNPCNPSGAVYSKNELEKLVQWAKERNVWIVADEIYERLTYDQTPVSLASIGKDDYHQIVTINGFSKSYIMTGWRLGYAYGSKEIIHLMSRIQAHMTSNASSISQYAGQIALEREEDQIEKIVHIFKSRRDLIMTICDSYGWKYIQPSGAFYLMIDISNYVGKSFENKVINHSYEFCSELLRSKKLATVPGIVFGMENYIRISYATKEKDIIEGLRRLNEFIEEMN